MEPELLIQLVSLASLLQEPCLHLLGTRVTGRHVHPAFMWILTI